MNILVLGCSGMLGSMLFYKLLISGFNVKGACRNKKKFIDKENPKLSEKIFINNIHFKELIGILDKEYCSQFDLIFNCVGYVKQRKFNSYDMYFINGYFPVLLNKICSDVNTKLIHFSTDCVFDGTVGNYTDHSIPDAQDDYGLSKALGENLNNNATILRTSIIGPEIFNKLGLLEWFLNNNKTIIQGFNSVIYTGITTLELSKFILTNFEKLYNSSGIFNLASDKITKYKLLILINKIFDCGKEILSVDTPKIDRSLINIRSITELGFNIKPWDEQISELQKFKML